jgi:hypothetical protein
MNTVGLGGFVSAKGWVELANLFHKDFVEDVQPQLLEILEEV